MAEAPVLPRDESLTVEFKSEWNKDKIRKTLVAFANTVGGDLYIGIDDHGLPVGVNSTDEIIQSLTSVIRDSIFPSMADCVSTSVITLPGELKIVKVHVIPGRLKPYSLDPKRSETVYIRMENISCPASLDDLEYIFRKYDPTPFEQRLSPEQSLTFNDLHTACKENDFSLNPQTNLQYGLWNSLAAGYTYLGFICSDQSSFSAVLVAFAEDEKLSVKQAKTVKGSVFHLLSEIQAFIQENNFAGWSFPSDGTLQRQELHYFSPLVAREAAVNAIAHRDYSRSAPITVHITPAAVEIFTIGGLPDLEPEQVLLGMAANCRNPHLAMLLGKLKLMEGIGNGFRQLRNAYPSVPLTELLTMAPRHFIIRLPRIIPKLSSPDAVSATLIRFLREHGTASRPELEACVGLSASALVKRLKMLRQQQLVEVIGKGPATRYRARD